MKRLALLALVLLASGCSTVATKADHRWGTVYTGTRCATYRTKQAWDYSGWAGAAMSFDVLFSALADTLLLPVDLLTPKPNDPYTPKTKESELPCRPL